jgi:pyruvate,water dikinase
MAKKLEVKNLTISFRTNNGAVHAVRDVSFDLEAGDGTLKGVPVSNGTCEGIVRIVNSADDANRLQKGEIMVAKFTDIGWTPYYSVVNGLITEIGSSLSHGAVVAREYGLPTIVNVKGATQLLKNGDHITMDAGKGTIIINA